MARPRYRLRTWIRTHLPMPIVEPNHDGVTERCYHCEVGTRPYDPQHFAAYGGADDDASSR